MWTNYISIAHLLRHFGVEVLVEAKVESWVLWATLLLQQLYLVATFYTVIRGDKEESVGMWGSDDTPPR